MVNRIEFQNTQITIYQETSLKYRIIRYSPKKINVNKEALYSVLNPETNSDSPSEKSKGVRLVSAKQEINHIILRTGVSPSKGKSELASDNEDTLKDEAIISIDNMIKASLISYEMVWAILRIAPIKLNLLFALHPMNIIG